MVEEKRYHKVKSNGKPILFHPNERWIQMKDLSDSSYYISDFGRIARLNPQGIFHEIKKTLHCKSIYVSIDFEGVHTKKRVGRMVLKYFVGGERPKRRYVHLNGDINDCRLKNLRWRKGFIDQVDFIYLKKVNTTLMSEESKIVKNYLETDDVSDLLKLIDSYKPLMKYKDFANNTKYFRSNDYLSFALIVIDSIKNGDFKPNLKHKEIISFKSFISSLFTSTSYRFMQLKHFNSPDYKINNLCENPNFDEQINYY